MSLRSLVLRSYAAGAIFLACVTPPVLAADYLGACGLPLPKGACGSSAQCAASALPDIPDYWHGLSPCLRTLRNQWSRSGAASPVRIDEAGHSESVSAFARRVVVGELMKNGVRFVENRAGTQIYKRFEQVFNSNLKPTGVFDMVQLLNDKNVPYNGMGQGDMGYMLYSLAEVAGNDAASRDGPDGPFYRAVARGAINTAITPTREGGLATAGPCGEASGRRCAWYHSVTRRDKDPADGLTLNQDLHVIRDLGLIADLTAREKWDERLNFERAVDEGLNQLFRAPAPAGQKSDLPVLADFLAPPAGSSKVRFLYYGYGKEGPVGQGGYFLNKDGKDCNYHVHVLDLMDQIIERQQKRGDPVGTGQNVLGCQSPLAMAYMASVSRFSAKDPRVWSAADGSDTTCHADSQETFSEINQRFYAKQFQSCRTGD